MTDAFTSTVATNAIARRVIRNARRTHPSDGLLNLMLPVITLIRNKGKLSRVELSPVFDRMIDRLKSRENIVDLRIGRVTKSALSANDCYQVRFIETTSGGEETIRFTAMELSLTRHALTIYVNPTHFYLHSHALARYMQRVQKPYTELLRGILLPMRASIMIGHEVFDGDIAIPVEGGMLLGGVVTDEIEKLVFPCSFIHDKNGSTEKISDRDTKYITDAVMMTFIDRESMGGPKERLLVKLLAWEQAHSTGISRWFEAMTFDNLMLAQGDTKESIADVIRAAKNACAEVVNSREWRAVAG